MKKRKRKISHPIKDGGRITFGLHKDIDESFFLLLPSAFSSHLLHSVITVITGFSVAFIFVNIYSLLLA